MATKINYGSPAFDTTQPSEIRVKSPWTGWTHRTCSGSCYYYYDDDYYYYSSYFYSYAYSYSYSDAYSYSYFYSSTPSSFLPKILNW